MSWVPSLTQIQDNIDKVSGAVLNPILSEYAARDQYLFDTLRALDTTALLMTFDQDVADGETVDQYDVVYHRADSPYGLAPALAQFTTAIGDRGYSADNTAMIFGIVKEKLSATKADVWTHGYIHQDNNWVSNMLQSGESFRRGPYFLSKIEEGKISASPSGVPVYVGFAIDEQTFFLNQSSQDPLSFFLAYKFELLDRPAGTPSLAGGIWSVSPNTSKIGWVSAAGKVGQPTGAKFFYNIPSDTSSDTEASDDEKDTAALLKANLPPYPFYFSRLTVNGVEQRFRDTAIGDTDGLYEVNTYGIWWFGDADGLQPWASDFVSWTNGNKGSDHLRPRLFLSFEKVNPNLKKSVVTSITPVVNGGVSLKSADDASVDATTGDLLISFGLTLNEETLSTDLETDTAIKDISSTDAGLVLKKGAVITSITSDGTTGVSVVTDSKGNATITNATSGFGSVVLDIEPEGARLKNRGLHSYLALANPASVSQGVRGKIVLPSGIPAGLPLRITAQLIGEGNTSATRAAFDFRYITSGTSGVLGTAITPSTTNEHDVILPASYTAYTIFDMNQSSFEIPASLLTAGGVVNFRLTRVVPSTNPYTDTLGILALRWTF